MHTADRVTQPIEQPVAETAARTVAQQVERLADLGVAELAGISRRELVRHADGLGDRPGSVLAVHPSLVAPSRLAPLLRHAGKPGFVVTDLTDLDEFAPIAETDLPDRLLYLLHGLDRGDDLRNRSPNEALPELAARGRSPLTVGEAISWLLQHPEALARNHCFMAIGSRKRKGAGLDARVPAVWISGGTGHDGAHNRDAPKVGWCWAGNRHTWLGFASALGRSA